MRDPAKRPCSVDSPTPATWGIECDGKILATYTCEDEQSAAEMVARFAASGLTGHVAVPLFRSPTLTDTEREAVARLSFLLSQHGWVEDGVVLCALLERLG